MRATTRTAADTTHTAAAATHTTAWQLPPATATVQAQPWCALIMGTKATYLGRQIPTRRHSVPGYLYIIHVVLRTVYCALYPYYLFMIFATYM